MAVNFHLIKNYIKHFFTAKRKGHDVHSPFVYTLCEEVFYNTHEFYHFKQLAKIRKSLLKNGAIIEVEDHGAGSKQFKGAKRKVADIVSKGISTPQQSEILFKLINYLQPATVVELGTSLGLNTLYLAMANPKAKVCSIEGSKNLHEFARQLAQRNEISNCRFIHGKFDDVLPTLLNDLTRIDLFYVDGNHTYEATMRYFQMAMKHRSPDSVVVFDDIYWSEGMTRAWEEIKKHKDVSLCVDAFYFGLVFFKEEIREKISVRILL
ncbi:MAG: O-methyltransferase-like protein [Bacteroidetes bacterium]|nr:O-methyltransferase-like protein [Bacteroidota bacterium]